MRWGDEREAATSDSERMQQQQQQQQGQSWKRNRCGSLLECWAELVLPWLTHQELAVVSLTCTTLRRVSTSISLRRAADAARALEPHPIPFHNSVDQHPYAYFIYTPCQVSNPPPRPQSWGSSSAPSAPSSAFPGLGVQALRFEEAASGCECAECGPRNGCPCVGFGGLDDVVAECGPNCACVGSGCGNRRTQRGIEVKLKVVRDTRKGWSLYADQFIPKGRFVCEYAGELVTTKEARLRQQLYDDLASGGHFSPALLVVREHLPSRNACLRLNIDATRVGNVSRFINHSCDGGNLSTVLVRSSGALLPRLCFFASKDIKPDEELTFSYGEIRVKSKGLQCFCGSSCCLGILPSEQT